MARLFCCVLALCALAIAGCDEPPRTYSVDAAGAVAEGDSERAARSAAPFADEMVRYLRGHRRSQGGEFILQVEFGPGDFAPRMESIGDVEALLVIMRDFPALHIAVEGHTDSEGESEKNQRLSQSRADWIQAFLVERGIDSERVRAEGFGDSRPIADNDTPEGQKQNRRLVVRVLESEPPVQAGSASPQPAAE